MFCRAVAISCYTVSAVAQTDTVARGDYCNENVLKQSYPRNIVNRSTEIKENVRNRE